jgi:hypothetical protein
MIGYHGTSADYLDSIIENGLLCCPGIDRNWIPSMNEVYFWGDNFIENECDEDDDEEMIEYRLIDAAIDSAQCAIAKAKDCRIVVVKFEVPDDEVKTDYSCENMESANCIARDVKPEEIISIQISNDLSLIRGYFIATMMNRTESAIEFTNMEKFVGELFEDRWIDLDDIVELSELSTKGS